MPPSFRHQKDGIFDIATPGAERPINSSARRWCLESSVIILRSPMHPEITTNRVGSPNDSSLGFMMFYHVGIAVISVINHPTVITSNHHQWVGFQPSKNHQKTMAGKNDIAIPTLVLGWLCWLSFIHGHLLGSDCWSGCRESKAPSPGEDMISSLRSLEARQLLQQASRDLKGPPGHRPSWRRNPVCWRNPIKTIGGGV